MTVPGWRSIIYVSGHYGRSLLWSTLEIFLIFYLTDVLGIPPKTASSIVVLTLVWDAMLDPAFGIVSDRIKTRYGKYGLFIIAGAPLAGLSFVAAFTLPTLLPSHQVTWLVLCILLFRIFTTMTDISHSALMARVFQDSGERSGLAQVRYFFVSLASLTIAFATPQIFSGGSAQEQAEAFRLFAVFAALIGMPMLIASWLAVADYDRRIPQYVGSRAEQAGSIVGIFRTKDALIILAVAFCTAATLPTFTKSLSYFGKYNLGDETLIVFGFMASIVGKIISTPFWGLLSTKLEKAKALMIAHLASIACLCSFYAIAETSLIHFTAISGLAGFALGGVFSMYWGMVPDVIDKVHSVTRMRPEAAFYGIVVFAAKIGLSVGLAIFGHLLDGAGFAANTVQSPETLHGIRLIMSFIPALGASLCIGLLLFYSLSHAEQRALRVQNKEL